MPDPDMQRPVHPCEASFEDCLRKLASLPADGAAIQNDKPVVPGLYLSWDAQKGEVQAIARQPEAGVLDLDLTIGAVPRWLALNIGLGRGTLPAGGAIGLAMSLQTETPVELTPFLRSAAPQGVPPDTRFEQALRFSGQMPVSTSLLRLVAGQTATMPDLFHTLVMPLPRQSGCISIRGLRLFVAAAPVPGGASAQLAEQVSG